MFTGNEGIDLYKRVEITESGVTTNYYISRISDIDLREQTTDIELTEL
jgi:hypothetical protein